MLSEPYDPRFQRTPLSAWLADLDDVDEAYQRHAAQACIAILEHHPIAVEPHVGRLLRWVFTQDDGTIRLFLGSVARVISRSEVDLGDQVAPLVRYLMRCPHELELDEAELGALARVRSATVEHALHAWCTGQPRQRRQRLAEQVSALAASFSVPPEWMVKALVRCFDDDVGMALADEALESLARIRAPEAVNILWRRYMNHPSRTSARAEIAALTAALQNMDGETQPFLRSVRPALEWLATEPPSSRIRDLCYEHLRACR